MNWLLRLLGLRTEAYVLQAVTSATSDAFAKGSQQGLVLGQTQGYELGHRNGYQIGLALGEVQGRQKLAEELQVAHGVGMGGEKPMEPEELATLKIRQVH